MSKLVLGIGIGVLGLVRVAQLGAPDALGVGAVLIGMVLVVVSLTHIGRVNREIARFDKRHGIR
jgi:hypothetical protein